MTEDEAIAHVYAVIDGLRTRFEFDAWVRRGWLRVAVDGEVAISMPVASLGFGAPADQVVDEIACLVVARQRECGMVH